MARLDRLAPVREIAQIGAAIGREFSYPLVRVAAAVLEMGEAQTAARTLGLEVVTLEVRPAPGPRTAYFSTSTTYRRIVF